MVLFTDGPIRLIEGPERQVGRHIRLGVMDDDGGTGIAGADLKGDTLIGFVNRIRVASLLICFYGRKLIMVAYTGKHGAHMNGFGGFERW